MKNNKGKIDTYETIYYVDLVVATSKVELKELQKLYTYTDNDELDDGILVPECATTPVRRKSDNKDCILVKFNRIPDIKSIDKMLDLINTVCHEAGHVCLDIYEHMNQKVCFCSSEPFCYLLGYIAQSIYATLKNEK